MIRDDDVALSLARDRVVQTAVLMEEHTVYSNTAAADNAAALPVQASILSTLSDRGPTCICIAVDTNAINE
jgi:hypothetical protein